MGIEVRLEVEITGYDRDMTNTNTDQILYLATKMAEAKAAHTLALHMYRHHKAPASTVVAAVKDWRTARKNLRDALAE